MRRLSQSQADAVFAITEHIIARRFRDRWIEHISIDLDVDDETAGVIVNVQFRDCEEISGSCIGLLEDFVSDVGTATHMFIAALSGMVNDLPDPERRSDHGRPALESGRA